MSFVSFNDGLSAMVISSAGICLVHSSWTSDRGSAAAHLPTLMSSATCCLLGKRDSWLADFVAFLVFFERLKRSTLECLALSLAVYQSKGQTKTLLHLSDYPPT